VRGAAIPVLATLVALGGCGYGAVSAEGSFGEVRFAPTGTVFAVIDAHREVHVPGQGLRVEDRGDQTLVLFFCEAAIDPDLDFAALSGSEIIELRETVRRGDRLLLEDVPLDEVSEGARLTASQARPDFSYTVARGSAPIDGNDSYADLPPLGRRVAVTLAVEAVALEEGGHVQGSVTIDRERADDQPANTATGRVTLRFDAPVVGERIGESNLDVLGL